MVGVTAVLARIPVIKFRKGGIGRPAGPAHPAASTLGSCPATAASGAGRSAQSAPMSTNVLSDVDLPARYQRQPLSEEEIAHINGGGIA